MVAAIFVSAFVGITFIAILYMAVDMGVFKPLTSRVPAKTKKLKARISELEKQNIQLKAVNQELKLELTARRLDLTWVEVPKDIEEQ